MFAPLDKSQLPAPYLEDYGYRLLPLRLFDGTLADSNRTNLSTWRQLFATVVSGSLTGVDNLPALADINARLATQRAASGAIPLLVQRLNYATLRPDALSAGLLTAQNDQLYDVPGRSASPYQLHTLFAVAPARSVAATGNVSFVFTQNLHIQSGGGSPRTLYLDFGDGRGYLPATWGTPLAASYGAAGIYRIKAKLTYGGIKGSTLISSYESQFDLQVLEGANPASRTAQPGARPSGANGTAGWVYPAGADSVYFAPNSTHSGGWVYLVYGGLSRRQLTKPFIVAEGYDVSHVAPDIQPNYTVRDFVTEVNKGNISNGSYFNFRDALGIDNNAAPGSAAYDLVFIDYNDGTDDIRRNAALFQEVVQYVNAAKQGGTATGQQNVVLGISMGGLIARYGLAQLEKTQAGSTHTRLLVTQDSPHRGANTPLGIQALTRQAASTWLGQTIRFVNSVGVAHMLTGGDIFPELEQADRLLDAPASQQLLLVRATVRRYLPFAFASTYGSELNSFIDNVYQPMIKPLAGQSFPYRFVATSLGSQCGRTTLNPYDELVRIEAEAFATVFLASAGVHTEVVVNAMPAGGQVERVSGLRVWFEARVLIFSKKFYFSRLDYHSPANNPIAWDGLPGGNQYINGQLDLQPGSASAGMLIVIPIGSVPIPMIVGYGINVALAKTFCFVPSASALDVPLISSNMQARYVNGAATTTVPPTAERFIAEIPHPDPYTGTTVYNSTHPFFTGRYGQWIYNEMERPFSLATNPGANPNPIACEANSECEALAIVSSVSPLCSMGTLSVQGLPAGATVTWASADPQIATIDATTGLVTRVPDKAGNVTFTATISVDYCTRQISAVFPVGPSLSGAFAGVYYATGFNNGNPPAVLRSWYDGDNEATERYVTVYFPNETGATYSFTLDAPSQSTLYPGPHYLDLILPLPTTAGYYTAGFTVTKTTAACGTVSDYYIIGYHYSPPYAYTVYPNPADDQLTVEQTDSTSANPATPRGAAARGRSTTASSTSAAPSQPYTVRLYDGYGVQRMQQATTTPALSLPTGGLPTGLYLLHIEVGGVVIERRRVHITH